MGRQLLSALSVAHAAGVMHRDVKPSNVLLGHDDRAVLTDFGIATFQGDPKLTQTGMVMGSPGFTAPERIRGEDASPASDLWSLGATLFAAVEGHGPFEKRGGAITTMSAIINEDAPEAPTAGALGPVIAALLHREPADRPDASAAARMITDVLPLLAVRTRSSAGYEPTALSASSHPAAPRPGSAQPVSDLPRSAQPGLVQPGSIQPASFQPRPPVPGEASLDFASAEQTIAKEPLGLSAAGTGPPAGGQASAAQTAPTTPQPVQGAPRPEGPPLPDFSSWYDPSPRSGPVSPAPQPGSGAAWSGSAPPASQPGSGSAYQPQPQPGYGPAPWSGSASQQPPGSAPWSDARPEYPPGRRKRPGLWWKIAAAVLAIVGAGAGVATVVLLNQSHSSTPPNRSSTSSTPATGTTLPPANLITAINQPLTGPPAAGYRSYSHAASGTESAGFTIDLPVGWTLSQPGAYQTNLTEPGTNIKMLVDLTRHTYPGNMLQEAQYIEAQSIPHFPGYQRIDLKALTIRDTPGSFWKFTWMDNGVKQEALDLLFILNTPSGQQSYALYATAPASMWQQMQPVFDEELRTFAPLPK
jgi:serine/threonine protein kinase